MLLLKFMNIIVNIMNINKLMKDNRHDLIKNSFKLF